jgi:hypothetical protein
MNCSRTLTDMQLCTNTRYLLSAMELNGAGTDKRWPAGRKGSSKISASAPEVLTWTKCAIKRKCCADKGCIIHTNLDFDSMIFWVPSWPKRNYVVLLLSVSTPTSRCETTVVHCGIWRVVCLTQCG